MKRTVIIILTIVLAIGLTACQKTPDDPSISTKDIDNMIEKATVEPILGEAPQETHETLEIDDANVIISIDDTLRALLGAPKKIIYEIVGKNGNLTINIDADIIIPNVYGMPVARVSKGHFSDDDIKRLNETFRDGEVAFDQSYSGMGAYAQYQRSSTPNDPKELTLTQDDAQTIALDVITKLELSDFYCSGKRITSLNNFNVGYYVTSRDFYYIEEPISFEDYEDINDFYNATGEQWMEADRNIYEFMFTRVINGIPLTYTNDEGTMTPHASDLRPWMYERILIAIDDKGVYSFKWFSPYIVEEIITEASALLPFSDIQDVIISMLPVVWSWYDNDERYSYEMEITEIRLGLMRITEKDVGETGLIIPVWDVIGTHTYWGTQPDKPTPLDALTEDRTYQPYMTINAIDGSIIDRGLGY